MMALSAAHSCCLAASLIAFRLSLLQHDKERQQQPHNGLKTC
jgi:hypothetical protein